MATFDKIIQDAVEGLYGDERLRANLTDSEAKVILGWAEAWITKQVNAARDEAGAKLIAQSELGRVRQTAAAINALAKKSGTLQLTDALAALSTQMTTNQTFTREEIFALITTLTSAVWQMRARK